MGFNPLKAIARIVEPATKAVGRVVGADNLSATVEGAVTQPGKAVGSVLRAAASDPLRATLAVTSFGGSELIRKVPILGQVYAVGTEVAAGYATGGGSILAKQLGSAFTGGQANFYTGAQPMALNVGGILQQVGGIFGGGQNPYFNTVGQVASLASQFFPSTQMSQAVQTQLSPMQTSLSGMPVIRGMATMLTKEIFDAGAKVLGRLGISFGASTSGFSSTLKRALSSIASLARRTPSGTMVSILLGLGLTALEANMLVAWHAQRKKGRRMNAANPRALRRAARRIKSFHRMCGTVDLLKSRGRRSSARCGSCKKSPCRC